MFFGARDDVYSTQPGDGYAAMVGGVKLVSTRAQASLFGGSAVGTIPHALIAAYGGDTVKATRRFAEAIEGVDVIALVDYDNDCVKTSLEVARALEGQLWGVRLDTAENMVDKSIVPQMGAFRPTGVNANLVWNVRNALDAEGFGDVKIVVSGGFDEERIRAFEEDGVPVDAYGVGAALYDGRYDFTADIVQVNGKPQAKAGRRLQENPRLERVK
jgi:nicotinate phosphoribosyltransferase